MRPGITDFLRYVTLDGTGRIALKPHGLLACIRFRGPEPRGGNVHTLDGFEQRLARTLERRGSEWVFHISQRRGADVRYPSNGAWPSAVVQALDFVREQRYVSEGQHLPTVHHLWIAYHPDRARRRLLNELAGNYTHDTGSLTELFEQEVGAIQSSLTGTAYDVQRLSAHTELVNNREIIISDLLSALHAEINLTEGQIAIDPEEPMFIDGILAPDELRATKTGVYLNGDHLVVGSVWGFPNAATSALFTAFGKLPVPSRYSARLIPLTNAEADGAWNRRSRRFLLGTLDFSLFFPRNGTEGAEGPRELRNQAEVERVRISAEQKAFATVLMTVVARCQSAEQATATRRHLLTIADSLNLKVAIETPEAAISAYFGSLPGEPDRHGVRRALMSMSAAVKLSPVLSTWHGPIVHPRKNYPSPDPILMLSTPDREPFRMYHHDGETGHMIIFGKTGLGKSVLLRALENGHLSRYKGGEVLTFDIGYSALKYALAIHGKHIVASRTASKQFAFLAGIHDPKNHPAILDDLRDLCELWLSREISIAEYKTLDRVVQQLATTDPDLIHLSAIAAYIQDMDLRDLFGLFTDSYLDGTKDTLAFDGQVPYWVIEYGTLGIDNARWVSPFIGLVQRRAYEAYESRPGVPRLKILDEGARAIKSRRMADYKERQDREGRKHNEASIFATQGPSEILKSDIGDAIIQQTATRISFGEPNAAQPKVRQQYLDVGFTEEEVELITTLNTHDFIISSTQGHQVVRLDPADLELAIYGGASDEDRQRVLALYEQWNAGWLGHYLDSHATIPSVRAYSEGIRALEQGQPQEIPA